MMCTAFVKCCFLPGMPKASVMIISMLLSSYKVMVVSGFFSSVPCSYRCTEKSSSSCLLPNLASFGFQIQTQMILILLPLKASMTPWILIVYLKRHSGACVGNKHVIRGKQRDGEYLTDIMSFNNGQLKSRT